MDLDSGRNLQLELPSSPASANTDNADEVLDHTDIDSAVGSEDGDVDVTLIHWMLSLSMLDRLRVAQNFANSAIRMKNAKKLG